MDELQFDEWLKGKFGYAEKSARDIRSRVKRAKYLVDVSAKLSDEEVIFKLSQHPEFKDFSVSVKSQLKRGVKLYREYARESSKEYKTNEGSD
ncbi:hypothetical protein ACFPVX_15665 [Cohnella faecalis]|uniref:hypothetical protein n=1 Tax=Cohnella faecalis TaxID=2315694 RepID=UPI0018F2A0A6|nr:hypothetical protein [Cohnella faecalis]